jgi:DNA-nicking Smr family endonuclease
MTRRRSLSDEEEALWSGYVRAIKPLRPGKIRPAPKSTATATRAQASPPVPRGEVKQPLSRPPAKPFPLAPIDRRFKQRVARGRDEIEARIDLHGMTQSEAHAALFQFLHRAQANGMRIALVVTGKGTMARDTSSERGVLRRQVPLWLALPEFRRFIVGFDEAHVSHGGQGALYVRLRRAR